MTTPRRSSATLAAALLTALVFCARASAGPMMSSGGGATNNTITRDVADAGGTLSNSGSGAGNNQLNGSVGEEVMITTAASGTGAANNRLRAGYLQVASYPNALTALTPGADVSATSGTFSWAAPGYDGGLGALSNGTSYVIQLASYTAPNVFGNIAFITTQLSTSATNPGDGVGRAFTGLIPNTSYFLQIWTMDNDANVSPPFLSTITTLANAPSAGASEFLSIQWSSMTVAWVALPASPPDASSKTSEGYVLQASSDNFGGIAPGGAPIASSTTYSVLASTLSLQGLDMSNTYYLRVGSLNWRGQPNYAPLTKLNFQIQQSISQLHFGNINPVVVKSTVAISSMVITNVGNWPATLLLSASTVTAGSPWTLAASTGIETATLFGQVLPGASGPNITQFSTPLTAATRLSGTAGGNYASSGGVGAPGNAVQIPAGQSRTFWFAFWFPASTADPGPAEAFGVFTQPVYP